MTDISRAGTDAGKPHPARVYDWLLGGKDNYAVDQKVGEALPEETRGNAVRNRAFMHRAIAWLAKNGGDQFLDIGSGHPHRTQPAPDRAGDSAVGPPAPSPTFRSSARSRGSSWSKARAAGFSSSVVYGR